MLVAAAMAGLRLQGADHRDLGVVDRALRVAREAEIDPGVGETRAQLGGDGEGLFGARGLAGGHPGLAESVMRLGPVGLGEAGVPRRLQGGRVSPRRKASEKARSRAFTSLPAAVPGSASVIAAGFISHRHPPEAGQPPDVTAVVDRVRRVSVLIR